MASLYRSLPLLLQLLAILPVLAEVRCRYNATAPPMVSYYTCTELATKYETSLEKFFLLNPLLDPDCTSIQAGKQYCVSGNVVPTSSDGTCKADSGKSCLGYPGGQCCNSQTWKCGNTKADCAAGTCAGGLCAVNDPSAYSLDGKCGSATGDKKCGGKWGDCCGKSTSTCGTESDFCGTGNCQYGNCTFTPPTAAPGGASPLPFYYYGNTTDGLCGPANDNKVCNVAWGFCCASTGKCGMGAGFCGTGCMPGYGNCTVAVVAPTPKPGDVSPDGTCGGQNGFVCKGSPQGDCCSSFGFCGSTDGHCKAGCQSKFGTCTGGNVSPDGSCGGTTGYTCVGSTFGTCCSKYGSCGTTTDHCQAGCQSQFGTCTGNSKVSPDGSCGGTNGYTCAGGIFGNCCSKYGSCGSTTDHCSTGCQSTFGTCSGGSKISPDASCGGSNGYTCKGSAFGDCCSASGYCGSTTAFCSAGCQASFGTCPTGSDKISTDGNCGGSKGQTCMGSTFGNCCSSFGSCGSTTGHCTTGCQSAFGLCTTSGTNPGGVSPDSTCGGSKKYTCAKSAFGGCCSSTGSCGSTVNHCAQGCQTSFSNSCMTGKIPTLDGSCGPKNSGMTCATGPFNGQCCGVSGFCGTTSAHCGTGCNAGYGKCN